MRAARSQSEFVIVFRRLLRHRLAILGGAVFLGFGLMAALAPWIAPEGPNDINITRRFREPSPSHPLGTDELGRDVLSRIMYGGRISIALGLVVALTGATVGGLIGAMSGYFGGVLDSLFMRLVDFMLAIPTLPIMMILSAIIGQGFWQMVFVLVIFGWIGIARIVRGVVLSLREQDFIAAARAVGASRSRIILRHVLPNVMAPIIVAATLGVASAILSESVLSYLGLGIPPNVPSWGNMLMKARDYFLRLPILVVWPGLCIFLTTLSVNFLGDGLRDAIDPRLRGR
ncbi:ABC transporter permease [Candidatus Bipolaricaulota bacterium]|nr:ABC transporter permease [Candidatus Bipolaricaulota bacterium]